MAGSKTDSFETRLLNLIFKNTGTTLAALPNVYLALFTTVPSDSSGGTEVSIGTAGYARKQCAPTDWTLTGGSITNATELAFSTVSSPGYTVVGWGVFDASSGGNMLYWGDTTSTGMIVGDIARFAPGALTITED